MRRYLPLLFLSFVLVVIAVAAMNMLDGYAGKQRPENIKTISVYTSLPVEQISMLAAEYEKVNGIHINISPLPPQELLTRVFTERNAPKADIILADSSVLDEARKAGLLAAFTTEQTDIVPERFKEKDSFWYGLWYDIFVFAVNQDAVKLLPKEPVKWADLANAKYRLAMTDFVASDAAAHLLYTLVSVQGEDQAVAYLGKLHPQVMQYSKFLATPPRMAGMGEADIAVAVQSEAQRYEKEGFPIKIVYPNDGTAYYLSGAGIVKDAVATADAKNFIDWLLQENAQTILLNNKFYFISCNPETVSAKEFAKKNVELLEITETLTPAQENKILERWIKSVRLVPR